MRNRHGVNNVRTRQRNPILRTYGVQDQGKFRRYRWLCSAILVGTRRRSVKQGAGAGRRDAMRCYRGREHWIRIGEIGWGCREKPGSGLDAELKLDKIGNRGV